MGQAAEFADQIDAASTTIAAGIQGISDERWRAATTEEGWTVCQAAAHIADAYQLVAPRVEALATEAPLNPLAPGELDAINARHAAEWANATRDDVIALLRTNAAEAAGMVRGLGDEQLDRARSMREGMPPISARAMIEGGLINHALGHFANIQSAIGPSPSD